MKAKKVTVVRSFGLVALLGLGCIGLASRAQAQDSKAPYPSMAPLDQGPNESINNG